MITFLLGIFRLGFLDVVLSRALLRGFVTAVAIVIMVYASSVILLPDMLTRQFISEQLIPMFGLTELEHTLNPQSTLDKFIFIVDNLFSHTHRITAIISFSALFALVLLRSFKGAFKRYWWIYRVPEVLVVVIISTSEFISQHPVLRTKIGAVLSAEFRWDEDGVDVLGSVPINTDGHFVNFPLRRTTLRFLRRTTSTAVQVIHSLLISARILISH